MPRLIDAILDSRISALAGRVIMTFMFWTSGVAKIIDWKSGIGDMVHFNLNPPAAFAIAVIIVQLGGSALVIWGGRLAWLGAGALAVFTVLTIPIAHNFWTMAGPQRMQEIYVAAEHVSIVGGLLLAAIVCRRDSPRA